LKGKKQQQVQQRAAEPASIKSGPYRHWDCEDRFLNQLFAKPDEHQGEYWGEVGEYWGDTFHFDYDDGH
jgi:hypothetical protein